MPFKEHIIPSISAQHLTNLLQEKHLTNLITTLYPSSLIPHPNSPFSHRLIPVAHILQPCMRSIRILLPLRPRWLQPRLGLTLCHQLANGATIVSLCINSLGPLIAHFGPQFCCCGFVDRKFGRMHDDAVVFCGARYSDKAAVDFSSNGGSRPRCGVAETAAAPGYPFEDVAWEVSVLLHACVKKRKERGVDVPG
jgi:hypothetical protein